MPWDRDISVIADQYAWKGFRCALDYCKNRSNLREFKSLLKDLEYFEKKINELIESN